MNENKSKKKNLSGSLYYQGESQAKKALTATNEQASDDYFQGKMDRDVKESLWN